ncbi:hypothetical protein ACHQM5_029540 [Ranunculus cassubicifolius]
MKILSELNNGDDEDEDDSKSEISTDPEEDFRNWLELPAEIMYVIFEKLKPVLIIIRARFVCSYWYNLSKQPHLYQRSW